MRAMVQLVEILALIVAVVVIVSFVRGRSRAPAEDPETLRLREEVRELKERIHVLERIATDSSRSLERQIDDLRDR